MLPQSRDSIPRTESLLLDVPASIFGRTVRTVFVSDRLVSSNNTMCGTYSSSRLTGLPPRIESTYSFACPALRESASRALPNQPDRLRFNVRLPSRFSLTYQRCRNAGGSVTGFLRCRASRAGDGSSKALPASSSGVVRGAIVCGGLVYVDQWRKLM